MNPSEPVVSWTVVEHLIELLRACADEGVDDPVVQPASDGGTYLRWEADYFTIGVELGNDGSVTWIHTRPRSGAVGRQFDMTGMQMRNVASMVARHLATLEP